MALPEEEYAPFLGIHAEPQGYECAHYRAPVYHCVFPVDADMDARHLADAVAEYKKGTWPHTPVVCLAFRGRGIVCPDDFDERDDLIAEIEFVKNLPEQIGDVNLCHWGQMRSFMGKAALRPFIMRESIVIYDIEDELPGRQIAEEVRLHFKHLRKKQRIDKLILRFPNGGSAMVHHYMKKDFSELHLRTAIQRARRMELPAEIAAVAA